MAVPPRPLRPENLVPELGRKTAGSIDLALVRQLDPNLAWFEPRKKAEESSASPWYFDSSSDTMPHERLESNAGPGPRGEAHAALCRFISVSASGFQATRRRGTSRPRGVPRYRRGNSISQVRPAGIRPMAILSAGGRSHLPTTRSCCFACRRSC